MNEKEREVWLNVCSILDELQESNDFTNSLKKVLKGY